MVPLPGREHLANPPGKKCPRGRSELLAQRVRVSLVSASARMGRASPCRASAATSDAGHPSELTPSAIKRMMAERG
jgi:hypothetical protein